MGITVENVRLQFLTIYVERTLENDFALLTRHMVGQNDEWNRPEMVKSAQTP
jgi:hypothetical protein